MTDEELAASVYRCGQAHLPMRVADAADAPEALGLLGIGERRLALDPADHHKTTL